jgi:hypothetical protein
MVIGALATNAFDCGTAGAQSADTVGTIFVALPAAQ